MLNYLIKILFLALFSFIVIYFYYFGSVDHIENFNGYFSYLVVVGIVYGIYKFIQNEKFDKVVSFTPISILGFFLFHLLVLSCLFFQYNSIAFGNGIILFFKILGFLILPTVLVLISLGFGKKIVSYLEYPKEETKIYNFILSLGIGFFSFVFLLDIFGILGFYNLYIVFGILIAFVSFSYKEILEIFKGIFSYKFELDIEEGSYLKLLSTEFLFLISTLVLSISLISVFRPFPIGWDDLGAYMNMPRLMAQAGEIIALGQMYAWQTFTGIGFMFGSATQAFYLNNVGGVLSFLVLVLVISDLFKTISKNKKTFINIPMLCGTIFISMPMIVFQQAKDMKLDPGLFFVSVISLYLVIKYYLNLSNKSYLEKIKLFIDQKLGDKNFYINNLLIILIVGVLSGFAFSIKFTSLLLISGIFAIIFYSRLGILGFLSYISIYFAIFTKANLWKMMNVIINPNNVAGLENYISISCGIVGIGLFAFALMKNKQVLKKFFLEIGIYLTGIIIALFPWVLKNISEAPKISIGSLISGYADRYEWDKTDILTQEEINKIEEEKRLQRISGDGITSNEDLGRYFGYEKGANNYVKLPWNLTMQLNQSGEYTEIGYIFLALIPVIFLFLPFRRKQYSYIIVLFLLIELFVFIKPGAPLIENSKVGVSQNALVEIFDKNNEVFEKGYSKNIYKINVANYIGANEINQLVNENATYDYVKQRATDLFYKELENKVLNHELDDTIELTATKLTPTDFNFIKELRVLNTDFLIFKKDINSIDSLEKIIKDKGLESESEKIINIWKNNRSVNQKITDILASYNLPAGYLFVLLFFFIPTFFFLITIGNKEDKDDEVINLFKLTLVFASFYTFLWAVSAFGIVWYGITMYFSFLLLIALGIYYISSHNDSDDEKVFLIKLFGSLILFIVFLIYIAYSVVPHSFSNLKGAGYSNYKIGKFTPEQANFAYHPEYLKILFYLNIAPEKREEFLKENISDNIKKAVQGIEKMDIYSVKSILKQLSTDTKLKNYKNEAIKSLDNIYKNVSNPEKEYINPYGIYRIGTFLKYHIVNNNKRLLNDSLLFNFNDYILDKTNINNTVDNIEKIGLKYLLFDLNAATIDKDERHNLTTRYENLLETTTSDRLTLVETDSICLKLALEEFNKSDKFSTDRERFMTVAGVNYESYRDDGTVIPRGTKMIACYNKINDLIKNNEIDDINYSFLLNLKNYISQNKANFKTDNDIYNLLQKQVTHGYKVLFEVKKGG